MVFVLSDITYDDLRVGETPDSHEGTIWPPYGKSNEGNGISRVDVG